MTGPVSVRKVEMYLDEDVVDQLTQLAGGNIQRVPDVIRQAIVDYLYLREIQSSQSQNLVVQDLEEGTLKQVRLK